MLFRKWHTLILIFHFLFQYFNAELYVQLYIVYYILYLILYLVSCTILLRPPLPGRWPSERHHLRLPSWEKAEWSSSKTVLRQHHRLNWPVEARGNAAHEGSPALEKQCPRRHYTLVERTPTADRGWGDEWVISYVCIIYIVSYMCIVSVLYLQCWPKKRAT